MALQQKITSHLWFDDQAEQAAQYYVSIFKNSRIKKISHFSKAGQEIHQKPPGSVMTVLFELEGQEFTVVNGGPQFKFNESISFIVNCETQDEIDYYWNQLTAGGDPKAQVCGWLKDKYGVSWQIIPTALSEMVSDPDTKKVEQVMQVFMHMQKIDLQKLKVAYNQ